MHRQVGLWRFQTDNLKRKSLLKRVFLERFVERIDSTWRGRPPCAGHLLPKPLHSSHSEHTHIIQATAPRADRQTAEGELRFHFCSRVLCAALMPFRCETDKSRQYKTHNANYCVGCMISAIVPSQVYSQERNGDSRNSS